VAQALSVDILFDAAVRIQLLHDKNLSILFLENEIQVKFPTTRRLAEFLDVPHYYVLPYFAMMEQENLVTRAERVGILTTREGTLKLLALMEQRYRPESEKILGRAVFTDLISFMTSSQR
jgi:DNA-binding transcriptional regulator YhcF (GntR family)